MGRPPVGTYWVVPGRFLAGSYPGGVLTDQTRQKVKQLLAANVTTFIDLTEAGEYPEYEGIAEREAARLGRRISYTRVPVVDMTPPTPAQMVYVLDTLDRALEAGRTVYVHCFAGIGRTGTVVGCWLARHGTTGWDALDRIEKLRRGMLSDFMPSPHRPAQIDMVLEWKKGQ